MFDSTDDTEERLALSDDVNVVIDETFAFVTGLRDRDIEDANTGLGLLGCAFALLWDVSDLDRAEFLDRLYAATTSFIEGKEKEIDEANKDLIYSALNNDCPMCGKDSIPAGDVVDILKWVERANDKSSCPVCFTTLPEAIEANRE